ncbi:PAS domain-containing protein [Pedobacter frigidisoli]|uniref:PAS domain-containing protein n=1 Tax=Pedobacter frigidisoli TaxID=2530455 RepID=UPI00292FA5B9|nr:PAS domain-containing protein [Pedobacter frigidisoli]
MNAPDFIRPEELLGVLFESPNATAVYSGEDVIILSANGAMLNLWGKDRTIIGMPLEKGIPELKNQPFIDILKTVWKSGQTYVAKDVPASLEINGRLQEFYFDFEYKAILCAEGKTRYILHTAFEVSERRAAWLKVEEKSIREQQLNDELTAINEEYQATNEELSALNEEYHVTNEELIRFQEQLQSANATIRQSESRFRALIEHAPIAIAIYSGEDMIIEQANEQMLNIWGRPSSAIGLPLLKARPELKDHPYLEIIRKVLLEGVSHMGYAVKGPVTSNGEVHEGYFDVTYKPLFGNDGAVNGIIVVANDVTIQTLSRIREEEINEEIAAINEELTASNEELLGSREQLQGLLYELNHSEERFRAMIEQSPVAMASLKGKDLIIEIVNDKVLDIWGRDRQIIGKSLQEALPELEGQPFLGILDRVFTSGEPFHGQGLKANLIHEGVQKTNYFNFVYQPVLDKQGNTDSILIVANDVTDQLQAKIEVDDLNARLQIALDASRLGSTEVVIATGKMKSTDQFKRNYGFSPDEEFTYADLFSAMLPEHRERVRGLVRNAMETNGVYKTEYPVKWRDGSLHWIQAHGRPRFDENGKADRMVGMTLDITEAKYFEQRKDDFLSIASHELKTPITSLKASIQLLERIKDNSYSNMHIRLIEQIGKSVTKMGILVDELLNMNRVSQDQLQLERTNFNLYDMLSLSCNHVRLEGKHLLRLSGEKDVIVYADEHRIDQVVINFVNNAVKYAPDSMTIEIEVEKVDSSIKVSVKDFGPGIQADILPNLFDRYYRVDHSGKAYSGLGLGLYICSEIIKKHGGEIGAHSEIGVGSTFWFTLPL